MSTAEHVKAWRARKVGQPIPPHPGSIHFYDNWKCRCEPCRAVKKRKMKNYRKRLILASLEDRQNGYTSART